MIRVVRRIDLIVNGCRFLAVAVLAVAAPRADAADCSATSVGLTPINDLGAGTYLGEEGGLYPDGANVRPPAHDAAGLSIANAITPIDGKIVMIALGMSNTRQEFGRFVDVASAHPDRNPALQILNTAQGGVDAAAMSNPAHPYWDFVMDVVTGANATADQVQVAWLKQALAGPNQPFPGEEVELQGHIVSILHNALALFPNLRMVFLSSRIYAGYATTGLNPEPYAYGSAFSVKWLIEDQIDGDAALNFDPDQGPVTAPWLSWSSYLWADGLVPRSDGLIWECSDLADDGTHPSNAGRLKVANLLLDFFASDPAATPWFLDGGAVGVADTSADQVVSPPTPNPFRSGVLVPVRLDSPARITMEVFGPDGRRVRALTLDLSAGEVDVVWDGRNQLGERVSAGVYAIRVITGDRVHREKVVRLD